MGWLEGGYMDASRDDIADAFAYACTQMSKHQANDKEKRVGLARIAGSKEHNWSNKPLMSKVQMLGDHCFLSENEVKLLKSKLLTD